MLHLQFSHTPCHLLNKATLLLMHLLCIIIVATHFSWGATRYKLNNEQQLISSITQNSKSSKHLQGLDEFFSIKCNSKFHLRFYHNPCWWIVETYLPCYYLDLRFKKNEYIQVYRFTSFVLARTVWIFCKRNKRLRNF